MKDINSELTEARKLDNTNASNPHDDPQFDNAPTQENPGNIVEFAYNSHIGNREKFLPAPETRGAKQSLETNNKE